MSVIRVKEVKMMIIAGSLKTIANTVSFMTTGITSQFMAHNKSYYNYFYGACLALVVCGVLHDTLLDRKSYLTLFSLNTIMILFQLSSTSLRLLTGFDLKPDNPDFNSFLIFANGFVVTLTNFFITILIPLNIAAKNRKSIELSSAGTTIATINLSYWLCEVYTTEIIVVLASYNTLESLPGKDYYGIAVVILLSIISNVIIWKPSVMEFRELKGALRKTCCRRK